MATTKGLYVSYNQFDKSMMADTPHREAAVPEGMGKADEIPIDYMYEIPNDEPLTARLIVETPVMRASRGVAKPKVFGTDVGNGKPSIPVHFDMMNPDILKFVGRFGNEYEFHEDDEGRLVRIHENPTEGSGVLGYLHSWCIHRLAQYLAIKKGKGSTPTNRQLDESHNLIQKKLFFYQRDEESNPSKFFKLMTYRPNTPEENFCKFYLPNGQQVHYTKFYDRPFEFTGFLSFRRIFVGEKISVTMELTEVVIHDILESAPSIPQRSARVIERIRESNPEQIDIVTKKYMMLTQSSDEPSTEEPSKPTPASGFHVDDIQEAPVEDTPLEEPPMEKRSRRPALPSRVKSD